jgi:hypothetical protein
MPKDLADDLANAIWRQISKQLGKGISPTDVAHALVDHGLDLLEIATCPCCLGQDLKGLQGKIDA